MSGRRPPEAGHSGYNPVVTPDGVRWRDYELAADLPADERRPPETRETHRPAPGGDWADVPQPVPGGDWGDVLQPVPGGDWGDVPQLVPGGDWGDVLQPVPGGDWGDVPQPVPGGDWGDVPQPVPGGDWAGFAMRVPGGDWLDGPHRPPRLDASRPYGIAGGLAWPDPQLQQDLCQAVPDGVRFPDPRGVWIRLVNGDGPSEDPFRATNALDCALAVISTWHGEPVVAAPRRPEYDRVGRPSLSGEPGGVTRAERWLGHRFAYVGQGRRAYGAVARRLEAGGHGAAAVLITRWPSGGNHAWNAVNSAGEVVWIDAQRGHTSLEPPQGPVTGVFCVAIDRRGRRL
ncbi:toxin glutamine deamidase domain-containing protein [Sphaerisporangium fuscum]|uniref:toxin glutamine deamidase domain-containing protein n=1 Tax=Sphaerisporangium fuscum TaxID=2835868 RepID=UPI0027E240DB|nr:toxin glutamine deamidase domain-containing protein [Sphaerisporangium fuscum]